ncbi:hypothetical protein [Curtobacterium sp. ZW137]|uniref:hypothetical protein n=1 Tax=Curtobacterium sp. ZW137 TaxID=2485104 RepID=UPI000F4CEA06|nr:hypothetical protein [Curtobacterium sp. ZW137]ROP66029.1 hypothetical protein EDF55_0475 [Curtobacterium sp. ZW137]
MDAWQDPGDDVDLFPERTDRAAGPDGTASRLPLIIGWTAVLVSSVVNVVLLADTRSPSATAMLLGGAVLALVAIMVVTVCGTYSSRNRWWLVLAGVVLALSPVVGVALASMDAASVH